MENEEFERIIADAIDRIPEQYVENLDNVAFVMEDVPTQHQMQKLHMRRGHTLFGLYEGIPKTARGNNYSGALPDKISIFKIPILMASRSYEDVVRQVRRTVWHEVAHHYGLNHDDIHRLEDSIL